MHNFERINNGEVIQMAMIVGFLPHDIPAVREVKVKGESKKVLSSLSGNPFYKTNFLNSSYKMGSLFDRIEELMHNILSQIVQGR